ncbi:hypothetical protein EVAR_77626_1 [Eumeta japonica]|uniref:Uncharacterized protein n=1 Tax=Eumeta variegata TaxID=151549 RepID=A0A4C1T7X2_EUMVA|nr:hypothetical protein EVAR_77626_1 [Eumeta japonica]
MWFLLSLTTQSTWAHCSRFGSKLTRKCDEPGARVWIAYRPVFESDQLDGSTLDQLNRSGPDLKNCPRTEAMAPVFLRKKWKSRTNCERLSSELGGPHDGRAMSLTDVYVTLSAP